MALALELHFFHGFLGMPDDWNSVIEALPTKAAVGKIVCHSLDRDCEKLPEISIEAWASFKHEELNQNLNPKVLVGYSLGGRLVMALDPSVFNRSLLIASHPGLAECDKAQRLITDRKQANDLVAMKPEVWLAQWNKQEVFERDRVRPERSLRGRRDQLSAQLQGFSLGNQPSYWHKLKEHHDSYFWCCGEHDLKFKRLFTDIKDVLGTHQAKLVADSGHGVIFDNPGGVAEQIVEVIGDC